MVLFEHLTSSSEYMIMMFDEFFTLVSLILLSKLSFLYQKRKIFIERDYINYKRVYIRKLIIIKYFTPVINDFSIKNN
jgi:hypothetical protein